MAKQNQWVSPHKDGWVVQKGGSSKPTKVFDTQKQAIEYGKSVAKNQKTELIIQGRNGRIRSKDSYGNDPCPPKDTEH